jgi:hypothetical protein
MIVNRFSLPPGIFFCFVALLLADGVFCLRFDADDGGRMVLPSLEMACSVQTPTGNVSVASLEFYGNVTGWAYNSTPGVLTVSLCEPMAMECSTSPAFLLIRDHGSPCTLSNVFTVIATPLSYEDNTAVLQLESSSYLANLNIRCSAETRGLLPDRDVESFFAEDTYFIYLESDQVCPGYTPGGSDSSSGADKLSRSATAGIVVGIFAVVLLASIGIVRLRERRRGQYQSV